jgi:hypothetical protein
MEVALALHECVAALTLGPRVVVAGGAAPSAARAATQWLRAEASQGLTRALGAWRRRPPKLAAAGVELRKQLARFAAWLPVFAARLRARLVTLWRERPKVVLIASGAAAFVIAIALTAVVLSHGAAPAPPLDAVTTTPPLEAPGASPSDGDLSPPAGDAILACLEGKFADHIEHGQPAGDARGIAAAHKAIYWIDLANRGRPTQVTLVWTVDGKEVQRQTLSVGHAPHWRTWGVRAVGDAREIGVRVLDAAGNPLKEDSVRLEV